MNFELPPTVEALRARIAAFVDANILPLEADRSAYDPHGNIAAEPLARLRAMARSEGLWCLQLPGADRPFIGRVGMAACYEEMNRSIFGPVVFNSAAPDDGNMMVLNAAGTDAQKREWLDPIVDGTVRSAFAMTEPHPGGGSDPSMIQTRAERRGGSYVVHGRKWFITGAAEASHFILVARTSDDPRAGLTAFLFHKDQPGWRIVRRIGIMGPEEHGGHCELAFEGLEIPARNVLLGEGRGLKLTQMRLGPARLTHCMRWLGLSKRCVEIALDYARQRHGFGVRLADRESIQIMLGDLAMGIEVGPASGDEGGLGARPGLVRAHGDLHGEGSRGEPARQGGGHGDPDQRRARLLAGHGARVDLSLCPAGAAGRRSRRGAQDGALAGTRRGGAKLLDLGCRDGGAR